MAPHRHLLFLLFFVVTAVGAQPKPEVAWLIYPEEPSSPSIEVWASHPGSKQFVWRLISGNGTQLAEMGEPPKPKGYSYNQGQCKIAGRFRHDVIALVKHSENSQWSRNVTRVWIASPKTKSFLAADTHGVSCLNEEWGI
jgi:hypothetical protein